MFQSKLFARTLRDAPKDEVSKNAELLIRGGFVDKLMAGVWTTLPLGVRVAERVNTIIREEMGRIGGVEIHMPALHPREIWEVTDRWKVEEMYKFKDRSGRDVGLGWTHEEVITSIAKNIIQSYRDLPQYIYQNQDKFRDEVRAKSGIIRSREFSMKDLYSFHRTKEELHTFYLAVIDAYQVIFKRTGLTAYAVEASGGAFTKDFSHEFQVVSNAGEDEILLCSQCNFARNAEIAGGVTTCPQCGGAVLRKKSIEVGNIFKLGTTFSKAFNLTYKSASGADELVWMGSYGIGPGRLVGTLVEVSHDERGIIWPLAVAPFTIHIIPLSHAVVPNAREVYDMLSAKGHAVLFDDREEKTAGERFFDADLIGIPWRVVVSEKTKKENIIEVKKRSEREATNMSLDAFLKVI